MFAHSPMLRFSHNQSLVVCRLSLSVLQNKWLSLKHRSLVSLRLLKTISLPSYTDSSNSDSLDSVQYHCPNCSAVQNRKPCLLAFKNPHAVAPSLLFRLQSISHSRSSHRHNRIANCTENPPTQIRQVLGSTSSTSFRAAFSALGSLHCGARISDKFHPSAP